jgi:hypothetical protein
MEENQREIQKEIPSGRKKIKGPPEGNQNRFPRRQPIGLKSVKH